MELLEIKDISFTYPNGTKALRNINLKVESGEFIALMGTTGSGKTSLLKMIKKALRPHGKLDGSILYEGSEIDSLSDRKMAGDIGYVLQNPEYQIVTDKVYHELAFGLENLGVEKEEIRRRVGEMANYFGINSWFHKNTFDLAGGEKQVLNLAGVLVMQPSLLLLDEPTSQLDPIAALAFLNTLKRINQELGITIILVEHRLEEVFPIVDRVIIMDQGEIIADDLPRKIAKTFEHKRLIWTLPTAVQIYRGLNGSGTCPLTVREGREFISKYRPEKQNVNKKELKKKENILSLKNIYFSFGAKKADVLSGLNLEIQKGEIFSLVGANGSGKTTVLKIIAGLYKPYQGKVKLYGKNIKDYGSSLYIGNISYLPQNPQILFIEDEVRKELQGNDTHVQEIIDLLELGALLDRHPYDLSGGEQQALAFGKILLRNPKIILLDEPTKGFDAYRKREFLMLLKNLQDKGITILLVTHDLEFAASCSDRCGLLFDGTIISIASPASFFSGNNFIQLPQIELLAIFIQMRFLLRM